MHNNILVAVVQSGLLFLGDAERMCMIVINEVIKKCLFIQSKCHDLEFVAGNPASIPLGDGRPSLGTRTLHVHSLSLCRVGCWELCLPIKIKQGTFLRKLSSEPGGETQTGGGGGGRACLSLWVALVPVLHAPRPLVLITAWRDPREVEM